MNPQVKDVRWRKANRSGGTNGNCVELANTLNAVRDSKQPDGLPLEGDVRALLEMARAGHYSR